MIIIPMEEAALLLTVHRVVSGVEVEDQVLRRGAIGGDELVEEDLGDADQVLTIDAVLEAAEGGRRGERGVVAGRPSGGDLEDGILAEGLVVNQHHRQSRWYE